MAHVRCLVRSNIVAFSLSLVSLLILGLCGLHPIEAQCLPSGSNIVCDSGDNTYLNPNSTTLTGFVDGRDGNDSLYNNDRIDQYVFGDAGNDSIGNFGQIGGFVDGGAGDDTIINQGSVFGNVFGDFGNDSIVNTNQAFGYIAGGVGNDTIVGGSLAETVLVTSGIDSVRTNGGNDTIIVSGGASTGNLQPGSGDDSVVINFNAYALTVTEDNFPGDDTLVNNGTIGLEPVLGPGGDSLVNNGLIDGGATGISSANDDGEDTIVNNGTIDGEIHGGPGDDSIVNNNSVNGIIRGGPGADIIVGGSLTDMVVSGDPGYDDINTNDGDDVVIIDAPGQAGVIMLGAGNDFAAIAGYVDVAIGTGQGNDTVVIEIGGGGVNLDIIDSAGSDSIVNQGSLDSFYSVTPGDTLTSDTLRNTGTIYDVIYGSYGGDLIVNGHASLTSGQHARINNGVVDVGGNDTILNLNRGFMSGINAGAGNDSIYNSSLVAGVMQGGIGSDTVTVAPGGLANYVSGDDDHDLVNNYGAVNTSLQGGIGNDTVTNYAGAVASWLDGFTGDDRVLNGGFVNADLSGGAGNDSVVNLAGAFVSQIYGDAGNDTVINGGYLLGSAYGGADNDIVVNLGGAQATSLLGEIGNDSVFNGGYLVSQLSGGDGDDTVTNAAFSYSAGADLGAGNDQFVNGGYLNGNVTCGAGNDTVSVGGYIAGGVACGDGSDLVYIFNGVVAGAGGVVTSVIDGGAGVDGLGFAFTVNVANPAAAQALSAAIAAASPAGGTITIAGVPYTWSNFEALYDLLQFNISEDVIITIPVTRRVNQSDAAAPVAIYCVADAVEIWTVGADGQGSFGFSVPYADVNAGAIVSAAGVSFESTAGGSFSVSATASDGKPYAFSGSCS